MPPRNRPFTSFLTQGMNNTNQNINNLSQSPQFNSPIQPGFGNTNYLNPPGGGNLMGGTPGGELFDDPSGSMGGLDTQDEWNYYQPGHTTLPGLGWGYPGSDAEPGGGGNVDPIDPYYPSRITDKIIENFQNYLPPGFSPISSIKDKPEEVPAFDFTEMGPPRRKIPPTDPKGKFWPELGYAKPPTSADFTELARGESTPIIPEIGQLGVDSTGYISGDPQQTEEQYGGGSGDIGGMDNYPDWYDPSQYDDFYHHWLDNPNMSYFDTAPGQGVGADLNNDGVADQADADLWNNLVEMWSSGTDYGTGMGYPGSDATPRPDDELPEGWSWQLVNDVWEPVEDEQDPLGNVLDPSNLGANYLQQQPDSLSNESGVGFMYDNKPYLAGTYGEGWEWVYNEETGQWSEEWTGDPDVYEDAQIGDLDLGGLDIDFDTNFLGITPTTPGDFQNWLVESGATGGLSYEEWFAENQGDSSFAGTINDLMQQYDEEVGASTVGAPGWFTGDIGANLASTPDAVVEWFSQGGEAGVPIPTGQEGWSWQQNASGDWEMVFDQPAATDLDLGGLNLGEDFSFNPGFGWENWNLTYGWEGQEYDLNNDGIVDILDANIANSQGVPQSFMEELESVISDENLNTAPWYGSTGVGTDSGFGAGWDMTENISEYYQDYLYDIAQEEGLGYEESPFASEEYDEWGSFDWDGDGDIDEDDSYYASQASVEDFAMQMGLYEGGAGDVVYDDPYLEGYGYLSWDEWMNAMYQEEEGSTFEEDYPAYGMPYEQFVQEIFMGEYPYEFEEGTALQNMYQSLQGMSPEEQMNFDWAGLADWLSQTPEGQEIFASYESEHASDYTLEDYFLEQAGGDSIYDSPFYGMWDEIYNQPHPDIEIDIPYAEQAQQAYLSNLEQYLWPEEFSQAQYAGGGGAGGQAARRLYYPSSTGGFAGVGSGIGGGRGGMKSFMESLLG